jgi:hypothetical protein
MDHIMVGQIFASFLLLAIVRLGELFHEVILVDYVWSHRVDLDHKRGIAGICL